MTLSWVLMMLGEKPFENMREGENTSKQYHLLLFHKILHTMKNKSSLSTIKLVICKCFQFGPAQNLVIW